MNFKPILFSTPLVQALLEKRKTQTRRSTGLKKVNKNPNQWKFLFYEGYSAVFQNQETSEIETVKFPYGGKGDVMYVRETWATSKALDKIKPRNLQPGFPCEYKAGGTSLIGYYKLSDRGKWKSSIFLPKHASRIFLEVLNVQIERIQQTATIDILAEGVEIKNDFPIGVKNGVITFLPNGSLKKPIDKDQLAKAFWASLWSNINGRESWDNNQWVFAYEFKEVSEPQNFLS